MARPLRIEYKGAFYHITARGNERKRIFFSKADYDKFKDYLGKAQDKYGYLLHCYMLMTNHYHLLIETPNPNMSKLMHYLNGSYTGYINRRRKRSGHLFQGRYKAILVDADSYFLELSRYVHLNPVRANMVSNPEDYPYSSYSTYISNKKGGLVHTDLILGMMSQKRGVAIKRYRGFVLSAIGENDGDPLKNLYGGSILGGKDFIKEALGRLKDRFTWKEEVSHRRELDAASGVERIIDAVADHFEVSPEDVLKDKREMRNIAVYLIKKWTSVTNGQIADMFGGVSCSAIAKANERFSAKIMKDRTLRKTADKISRKMSYVKG